MSEALPTQEPQSTAGRQHVLDRLVVATLFLLSGFSALIYELVWTQQFALVFGATATATSAVLAAYMFGLGLGAALIARKIGTIERPVLWYAGLECGIAVAALLVAPALEVARAVHGVAFQGSGLGGGGSALFYLVCSFVILAVPTAMMGATLPLLVRFWMASSQQISRGVASLYMVNTLGAATGTLATAFLLIPRLGLGRTLAVAVTINLVIALVAALRFRKRELAPELPEASAAQEAPGSWSRRAPLMCGLIFGSGLVGMAYEVYWVRVLTHPLGGSLYAFATMLAAFLLGISFGSLVTVARRFSRRASWAGFGCAQLGIAVSALLAIHAFSKGWLESLDQASGLNSGSVLLVGLTLFPGAVLLGVSFPLAVRAVSPSREAAAAGSARIFASNTVGTILGSVLCGFVFLPRLQFDGTATLLLLLSLLLAGTAFLVTRGPWNAGAICAGMGLIGVALWPPPTPWALLGNSFLKEPFNSAQVSYLGVGRSATVMLQEQDGEYRLTTNGLPESAIQGPGSRPARYSIARWLALLPATTRPDAERALVIGLGAGITSQALPQSVTRVDVAEIEPEVVRANHFLSDWRAEDPLSDPRLNLILNDARNVLTTQPDRYDLVISQPSHPWTLGAASLFTSEFFSLVSSRLTESGVFVQWLGLRFVNGDLLRSQVATLLEHFRFVEMACPIPSGAVLLLAANEPLDLEDGVANTWARDSENWRKVGIETPEDILLGRCLDAEGTRTFAEGAQVSKDYRNLLLTRSPWLLEEQGTPATEAIAPLDALRTWQGQRQDLYPLRRLLQLRQFERASRALDGVTNPELREIGQALWDQTRGNPQQALLALERRSQGDVGRVEALAARLIAHSNQATGVPPSLVETLSEVPELLTVYQAWRRLRLGDWQGVGQLDGALSTIEPVHPIYPMALRMRLLWRQSAGDADLAREALHLAEPQLSMALGPQALMLRARLALTAEDTDTLFATLLEFAGRTQRRRIEPSKSFSLFMDRLAAEPTLRQDPRWPTLLETLSVDPNAFGDPSS